MNPLILLFKTFSLPLLFAYCGDLAFISQADIVDSVSVYTVYRDIAKVDLHLRCF
jgi:hypothetical protein